MQIRIVVGLMAIRWCSFCYAWQITAEWKFNAHADKSARFAQISSMLSITRTLACNACSGKFVKPGALSIYTIHPGEHFRFKYSKLQPVQMENG